MYSVGLWIKERRVCSCPWGCTYLQESCRTTEKTG